MAEPKPATPQSDPQSPPAGSAPKLVAVSEQPAAAAPTQPDPPKRRGISRGVFALVTVLLVLALGALFVQTRHARTQAAQIAALEGQVGDLEGQLAVATEQLAAYDRTLGDVRGTVSDLFERIATLNAMVQIDPRTESPPADR